MSGGVGPARDRGLEPVDPDRVKLFDGPAGSLAAEAWFGLQAVGWKQLAPQRREFVKEILRESGADTAPVSDPFVRDVMTQVEPDERDFLRWGELAFGSPPKARGRFAGCRLARTRRCSNSGRTVAKSVPGL